MDLEEDINYAYLYQVQLNINQTLTKELEEMKQKYAKLEAELLDAMNTLLELEEENLNTGPIEAAADEY